MRSSAEDTKKSPDWSKFESRCSVWFEQSYCCTLWGNKTKANLFWREWTFCSLNFNSSDILSFWTVTFSRLLTTRWTQCEKYIRPFTITQTNKQKNSETGGKLSSKGRKESSYQHHSTDIEKHLKSIEHNHSTNTRHSKGYIKGRWRVLSQWTTGAQEIRLLQTPFHINLILTHPFFSSWTSFSLFRRFSSTLFFWLTVSSTLSSKQP